VRVARALDAARDSVDRIDSLIQRHAAFDAINSMRREISRPHRGPHRTHGRQQSRPGTRSIVRRWRSPLRWIAHSWIWAGSISGSVRPARPTHRAVGIPDPDNTLHTLAVVDLQSGSVSTPVPAQRATRCGTLVYGAGPDV